MHRAAADGAIITQFDYPTCEALGLIKMDFLGPAQPDHHRRRAARTSRPTAASTIDLLDAAARRPADLRAAGPGRHAGRVPARRRPAMRSLLRLMQPGQLRGHLRRHRAVPARPDGRQLAHQLRRCARTAGSRSPRSTRSWRSRSRRSSAPRYGLIVYQEQVHGAPRRCSPATRSARPTCCAARWARRRRRVLDKEFVPLRRRAWPSDGYSDAAHQGALGRPGAVRRLRVQQGALRRLRPGLLLDRVPQGQLPGRVHGRAAHLRRRRQGQVGALPGRVPADGHQGAAAGRQRLACATFTAGRHRHPLRPRRDPQRRRQRRRRRSSRTRKAKGEFTSFADFLRKVRPVGLQQADHRVADQGRRLRLARPPRARAAADRTSRRSTP